MASLIALLRQRLEYTEMKVNGPLRHPLETVAADVVASMASSISRISRLTVEDSITLQAMITASILPEASQRAILAALDAKVSLAMETRATEARQKMINPECYQSEGCWALYLDMSATVDAKLMKMAHRLRVLGCRNPDETSFAAACAIALHAHRFSAVQMLQHTRNLKFLFGVATPFPVRGPDAYGGCSFSLDLQAQIDADGPIVPCKIDPALAAATIRSAPCRKTRHGCQQVPVQRQRSTLSLDDLMQPTLEQMPLQLPNFYQMALQYQMSRGQGIHESQALANGNELIYHAVPPRRASPHVLALEDRPPTPALSDRPDSQHRLEPMRSAEDVGSQLSVVGGAASATDAQAEKEMTDMVQGLPCLACSLRKTHMGRKGLSIGPSSSLSRCHSKRFPSYKSKGLKV